MQYATPAPSQEFYGVEAGAGGTVCISMVTGTARKKDGEDTAKAEGAASAAARGKGFQNRVKSVRMWG